MKRIDPPGKGEEIQTQCIQMKRGSTYLQGLRGNIHSFGRIVGEMSGA